LLHTVSTRATDLWHEDLHLARRRVMDEPTTPGGRLAHVLIPAAVTAVVVAIGLGRPSLWTDEFQSWGMAKTPWSQLLPILKYVDAVHGLYYVLLHLWVDVFGDSDVALRIPSLLAMAASAGFIGAIGNRLSGRATGLLAGIVFAALPSTTRYGAEARQYAIVVLVACVATWLLLQAWQRPNLTRWWLAYGLTIALLGWLHMVALLMVAAHAWITLAWHRRDWWRFGIAAAFGTVACLPIVHYGYGQKSQVAYIEAVSSGSFGPFVTTIFGGTAAVLALSLLAMFSLPLRRAGSVYAAWAVVPTALLIGISVVMPLFLARYLVFTTPGWALLAGAALARVRPAVAVAVLALLVVLAGSTQLRVRGPAGHGEANRELAAVVGSEVQAGDGIVYADDDYGITWTMRDAIAHYLPGDYRPKDVLATSPPRTDGHLAATECTDVSACIGNTERLWVVRLGERDDPLADLGKAKEAFIRPHYQVIQTWHLSGVTVALLERLP
jgi:mannosyltransferase